jgi:hypothetical protein
MNPYAQRTTDDKTSTIQKTITASKEPLMKKTKKVRIITTDKLVATKLAAFKFKVAVSVGLLGILAYSLRR